MEFFLEGFQDSGLEFQGPGNIRFEGSLFLDGSCIQSKIRELSRAGWAFVLLSDQGHLLARVLGPVCSHLPQSSQAGEFAALAAA
eukprot:4942670-Pyramimonas_sp.AAC.1